MTYTHTVQKQSHVMHCVKIARLVMLCKEKSHVMPNGLTREQRQQWAKTTRQNSQ